MTAHTTVSPAKPKLLDEVRSALRLRHYSPRTEETYIYWIRRFILFHKKRHPGEMSEPEISQFLNHLAEIENVASSTQNQALCAIVFLYKHIIKKDIDALKFTWAKKPKRLPVVLTRQEIKLLFENLSGVPLLMASLLYRAGLRLSECLQLRVQDIDFGYKQIIVHDAKGAKDRVTILPEPLIDRLKSHINKVKNLHEKDIAQGYGSVALPYALEKKYPNAANSFNWQWVFPAPNISTDPKSGIKRRHHQGEWNLQRAIRLSKLKSGITKHVGCHTFTP